MSHNTHLRYMALKHRHSFTERELEQRRRVREVMAKRRAHASAPAHPATEFRHPRPRTDMEQQAD